ncbi:MAG TPA: hypothetical protein VKW09_09295 [bacterium]|nr:hypothetical protein [bacterium]
MSPTVARCFAAFVAIGGIASFAPGAWAHEHRTVATVQMTVGWGDEPTYTGFKNSVQLILQDKSGKPITDLVDTLKVEVRFGSQSIGPLDLERAFAKTFGRPGDYRAQIVPTRPGTYSFHFIGTVDNQKIDQTFTSSSTTFDNVQDAAAIEFPVKDPSTADLGGRLDRIGPRVDEARAAAGRASTLGAIGLVAGVVGIAVGLGAMRRRRPG